MAAMLPLGVVRMRGCVVRDHIMDKIIQVDLSTPGHALEN
jgi:hypothetical protein